MRSLLVLLVWSGRVWQRVLVLLWPDAAPDKSHASPRQRLFRLCRDTGHALVQHPGSLCLAPNVAHELGAPGPDGQPLLAGLAFGDLQAFDDWLQGARAQWDARRVDRLAAEAARAQAEDAWVHAFASTQRLLALAPL